MSSLSSTSEHDRTELAVRIEALSTMRWGDDGTTPLIGTDASMYEVQRRLLQYAQADSPMLITGETGTGKELFARAAFLLSSRHRGPFLTVNCAQFADGQLMASELFGHKRGSFTGAVTDHRGFFEAASGGLLFLDEVGELVPSAQAMLLRALSEGEIVPVGETHARRVNTRLIAATSHDLRTMMAAGAFRADLYYRLHFLQLRVPALRERGNDWRLLTEHFLRRSAARIGIRKRLSSQSWAVLARHPFHGNVRELQGLTDVAYYGSEGDLIEPEAFIEQLETDAMPTREAHHVRSAGQATAAPAPADVASDAWRALGMPAHAPADHLSSHPAATGNTSLDDRFKRMRTGACFWTEVYEPFMSREINRAEVRALLDRGLRETRGSYKRLTTLFGITADEYLRFMDFLRHHRLKPDW